MKKLSLLTVLSCVTAVAFGSEIRDLSRDPSVREVWISLTNIAPGFCAKLETGYAWHGYYVSKSSGELLTVGGRDTIINASNGLATGAGTEYNLKMYPNVYSVGCDTTDELVNIKMYSHADFHFSDTNPYHWFYYPDKDEYVLDNALRQYNLLLVRKFKYVELGDAVAPLTKITRFEHDFYIEPKKRLDIELAWQNGSSLILSDNCSSVSTGQQSANITCDFDGTKDSATVNIKSTTKYDELIFTFSPSFGNSLEHVSDNGKEILTKRDYTGALISPNDNIKIESIKDGIENYYHYNISVRN